MTKGDVQGNLMNLSFENKVALVTGAASGMGLATAQAFAEAGASVDKQEMISLVRTAVERGVTFFDSMTDITQEEKEKLIGFEVMRMMQLSREYGPEDLLDSVLAGREKKVENVTNLYSFVLRNFGDVSRVTGKVWEGCSSFLKEAGLSQQQLEQTRGLSPRAGEPGFRSILDEMHDEGLI
jgi:hypothetical protein